MFPHGLGNQGWMIMMTFLSLCNKKSQVTVKKRMNFTSNYMQETANHLTISNFQTVL